jgi:hypothetical protein
VGLRAGGPLRSRHRLAARAVRRPPAHGGDRRAAGSRRLALDAGPGGGGGRRGGRGAVRLLAELPRTHPARDDGRAAHVRGRLRFGVPVGGLAHGQARLDAGGRGVRRVVDGDEVLRVLVRADLGSARRAAVGGPALASVARARGCVPARGVRPDGALRLRGLRLHARLDDDALARPGGARRATPCT